MWRRRLSDIGANSSWKMPWPAPMEDATNPLPPGGTNNPWTLLANIDITKSTYDPLHMQCTDGSASATAPQKRVGDGAAEAGRCFKRLTVRPSQPIDVESCCSCQEQDTQCDCNQCRLPSQPIDVDPVVVDSFPASSCCSCQEQDTQCDCNHCSPYLPYPAASDDTDEALCVTVAELSSCAGEKVLEDKADQDQEHTLEGTAGEKVLEGKDDEEDTLEDTAADDRAWSRAAQESAAKYEAMMWGNSYDPPSDPPPYPIQLFKVRMRDGSDRWRQFYGRRTDSGGWQVIRWLEGSSHPMDDM
jgi:hypothetical protein